MHPDAPPPEKLRALAATISTNLIVFAALVLEWGVWLPFQAALKRSLRAKLRRGMQAFQRIVFLLAVARLAPPKPRTRAHLPANAPLGFRLRTSRKVRRFIHMSGLHEGSIKARIARLKRMLETIELWVARFLKRLCTRRSAAILVLTYAIAALCADLAGAPAPRAADTS